MYSRAAVPLFTVAVLILTGFADAYPVRDIQIPLPEEMGPDVLISDPDVPLSPPPDPQVGDSWIWWLWIWYPMPPQFEQHVCTVRGKSDRGYVVVKDSEWLVSIDQADVDAILEHWENSSIGPYPDMGIYEIDSLSFGTPPDELDNDPGIYLMWYDFEVAADGFFAFDEYPEGTYPDYHSNECEVLYLNTMSSGGPSGNYMHGVIAHEFEHLIHWKQDENEASWVDEGMAELAMWFFGNPDNISSFSSNPDNNLTEWGGEWADYIQTYLWSLYFFEQYGGHDAVFALVAEQANSMAGYDNVLDDFGYAENTEDIFIDWSVANFLDDETIGDGRFGYTGEDLPAFMPAGNYSTYPVEQTKTVNHWATDYYRFQNMDSDVLDLVFDGSDDNQFKVRALVLHQEGAAEVTEFPLDLTTQSGVLQIDGLTDPQDQVVLVVASVSSTGGTQYSFSANGITGIDMQAGDQLALSVTPVESPFSGTCAFTLQWSGGTSGDMPWIAVYDMQGRICETLVPVAQSPNTATAFWNSQGRASGLYLVQAGYGSFSCASRVVLLP